jgi:glycosyltransferase involved in cell wall biosynthesis
MSVLEAVWALPRFARRWGPDVVHLHSSFAGVVGAATIARSWPTAYSPHGYAFAVPRNRLLEQAVVAAERFVAHRVAVVATVSESEADEARKRVKAARVTVVANGIPELDDGASASNMAAKIRRVVALGRPVPQRQPVEAAQILAAVAENADVAWIGGGYEDGPGVAALRNAGIPITGWLPRDQALDELDRAMVYLHWTAWDGLPLSILEAMARDVVVVAHDIPSSREVIGPEQVCLSPDDAVSLVKRVLDDSQFREHLLSEQRRRRRFYGAERMVQNWSTLYATLATRER